MRSSLPGQLLLLLIGGSLVVLGLLFSFASPNETQRAVVRWELPPTPTLSTTIIPTQSVVLAENDSQMFVPLVRVVDGDTITVLVDGKRETIRLIGINTPETVDPRRPVECFGKESSNKAKELLTGKQVRLASDPTQQDRDRYGRLLRYVYLADGTFVNELLIEEGFAYEYTYHTPYQYQEEFRTAQEEARKNQKGLWGEGICQ